MTNLVVPLGANPASAVFVDLLLAPSRNSWRAARRAANGSISAEQRDGSSDALAHVASGETALRQLFSTSGCPAQLVSVRLSVPSATIPQTGARSRRFWPVAQCAWGCEEREPSAGCGRPLAYCQKTIGSIQNWWGRMARVWSSVERFEATGARGALFESVLLARPDLVYGTPLAASAVMAFDRARFWYSALVPPDGLWLFNRRVARDVLLSVDKLAAHASGGTRGGAGEASRAQRCTLSQPLPFYSSWLLMCYWADQHWDAGGRVRLFAGINASVVLQDHAHKNVFANAKDVPPPLGFAMLSRPSALIAASEGGCGRVHTMHDSRFAEFGEKCGWVWPESISQQTLWSRVWPPAAPTARAGAQP